MVSHSQSHEVMIGEARLKFFYIKEEKMTTHDGSANYVGRLWDREQNGPILVLIKNKEIYDITHCSCATISELMEKENIHEFLSTIEKNIYRTLKTYITKNEALQAINIKYSRPLIYKLSKRVA